MISPLIQATARGYDRILELLLEHGAEVNDIKVNGWSSLHCAALLGHEVSIQILITRGVEINHQDKRGCTALHYACSRGYKLAVKVLLDHGAESFRDENGDTPLHRAAMANGEQVVELLLKYGVDPSEKSTGSVNKTPLFWAVANANSRMLELLLGHGSATVLCDRDGYLPWNFRLPELDGKYSKSFFDILLRHGWDKNEQDGTGFTVLHYAAGNGNEAVTRLLISLGCDLFIQDEDGDAPIDVVKNDGVENLLLEAMMEDEEV